MASPHQRSANSKPTPAFVRVVRAYLRNVTSPTVWAPMAVIALLLALSADYWQSLQILETDADASQIGDNTSQLADTVSEDSTIAASDIDSSDVLLSLLAQTQATPMDEKQAAQAQPERTTVNLDDVDLLELPDFSATNQPNGSDNARPKQRLSLADILFNNYNTVATPGTAEERPGTNGAVPTRPDAAAESSQGKSASPAPSSALVESQPSAAIAQSANGFSGYPYGSPAVPSTSFSATPVFTGYPATPGAATTPTTAGTVPATMPATGYTGYPPATYTAPATPTAGYNPAAVPTGAQYGSQPNSLTAPVNGTGVGNAPAGSTPVGAQNGYATGVPNGAVVEGVQAVPYSTPRSVPGRYIGNGEINTFANP